MGIFCIYDLYFSAILLRMDEPIQPAPAQPTQNTTPLEPAQDTVQQRTHMVRNTQNFVRLVVGGFAKIFGEIMSMIFRR